MPRSARMQPQIRAVSRVGFGFANPAGIVRLYDAA